MASKPPISVRRPARQADPPTVPTPIKQASVPTIDPDGPEAVAFTMRGRVSSSDRMEGQGGQETNEEARTFPPSEPPTQFPGQTEPLHTPFTVLNPSSPLSERRPFPDDPPLISVKLPPETGRQLAAVADRRGSKRTLVAIEVLTNPLRELAQEHRAGRFPELPRIISGTVRSSIAFSLPPDLAADLEFVLFQRKAVRAQVVTRLLVPAIDQVYRSEIGEGRGVR
jgi:hypothetical protein